MTRFTAKHVSISRTLPSGDIARFATPREVMERDETFGISSLVESTGRVHPNDHVVKFLSIVFDPIDSTATWDETIAALSREDMIDIVHRVLLHPESRPLFF